MRREVRERGRCVQVQTGRDGIQEQEEEREGQQNPQPSHGSGVVTDV